MQTKFWKGIPMVMRLSYVYKYDCIKLAIWYILFKLYDYANA